MFDNVTKMVKTIFYLNILVFGITLFTQLIGLYRPFIEIFALYNFQTSMFEPWQLITHMFLHGGFMHIAFNMWGLLAIAPFVESALGGRKFLIYYLIAGLGGCLLHMISLTSSVPMLGASGALYGIASIFAYLFPNEEFYLFFIPIGIPAKYLMPFFLLVEVYCGFFMFGDGVAHFCHVGGALTGLGLIAMDRYFPKSLNKYL